MQTKLEKSPFRCILNLCGFLGDMCGKVEDKPSLSTVEKKICVGVFEPSIIDCDRCEFACKSGRMISLIEYGRFDEYVCKNCGFGFGRKWFWCDPCPKCGSRDTSSKCLGNPHVHGKFWIFELHILDHSVAVTLGEFLGVEFDNQLRYSCKGSWHNFRNDSSGFDVCHVNCLNDLIDMRIRNNLRGEALFMANYPKEGKILLGNNKIIKYWKNGIFRPKSEYFEAR